MTDDSNRLEPAFTAAADALGAVYESVADAIHRHASLRTVPTSAEVERWARAIDCATNAVQRATKAVQRAGQVVVRSMVEPPLWLPRRLQ